MTTTTIDSISFVRKRRQKQTAIDQIDFQWNPRQRRLRSTRESMSLERRYVRSGLFHAEGRRRRGPQRLLQSFEVPNLLTHQCLVQLLIREDEELSEVFATLRLDNSNEVGLVVD
mmetsp:Transcript_35913/g.115082  ORF Transcript_35913/g.115082 Transcript_35913/m.115082 type:complete len:115 (-) Transcript_35913:197-541(-)